MSKFESETIYHKTKEIKLITVINGKALESSYVISTYFPLGTRNFGCTLTWPIYPPTVEGGLDSVVSGEDGPHRFTDTLTDIDTICGSNIRNCL